MRTFFGCEVEFGAARDEIILPAPAASLCRRRYLRQAAGGIANDGASIISAGGQGNSVSITGNTASYGGGILNRAGGTMSLSDATIGAKKACNIAYNGEPASATTASSRLSAARSPTTPPTPTAAAS